MFPSNQSGIGINSSFGLVPLSGRSSTGSTDETRSLAFNWLSHLSGPGVGLSDEQQTGLKVTSDQIMDRSFMSIDRHTPSVPRRTPHSNVGGASGQPGSDAPQHPIQDASMVNTFHPYRLVSDGLSAAGHPSLSTSQFAAFDSLYKAYQGAYGSAAPGGVFGTQPFRFDSPLLADQRMMLQASLLQYPHLGIFPNPALYPGLPGAGGVRYPGDYYGQNLPGMPLSSKYADVGGPSWLGMDRSMPLLDRDKDMKDGERKTDLDLSKRPDKDDHHRSRPDREDMVAMRRDLKDEARRCEDNRRDPSKHTNDKDSSVKKDQQKRSNSLKSPIRQEGHHSSSLDGNLSRCNSGGPSDFSFPSGRVGHVMPGFTMSTDISNLPKVSSSPGGATSQQRQTAVRNDRNMEPAQDHARAKDRHHHHHHHHHHHGWKADEAKAKMAPLVLTVPKTTASTNTNGQQQQQPGRPSTEKKFHRPFEQTQMNCTVPAEKHDRLPALAQKDASGKTNRVSNASSDFLTCGGGGTVSDSKTGDYRYLQHQYQQQQQRAKGFETKGHPHSATSKKQGASRCDDAPLNLVMTKSQNFAVALGPTLTDVIRPPLLSDGYEFPRTHRVPPPPVVPQPAHPPLPDAGFLAQTWGLTSPEDVRLVAKPGDVPSSIAMAPVILVPVSKLDLEAKRRMKVRKNEECNSEDEEEEEDEDVLDSSKDTARLLLIDSGPPLKDPITVAKSNYLSQFGLVSLDSSKEMAFEQRRKRHKLFRERSISPTVVEDGREPEQEDMGSTFRNESTRLDKHSFLGLLDLESVRSHPKKRKVMPGGQSERDDLAKFYRGPASSHSTEPVVNILQNQHIPSRMANSQYNSSLSQLDPKHQDTCRPRVENSLGGTIVGTTSTDLLVDRRPFASVSDAAALFTGESADRWTQAIDGDRSSRDSKHAEFVKSVPDGQSAAAHAQEEYRHSVAGSFPLLTSVGDGHCAREGLLDTSPFNINSRNASTPSSASREVTNGQMIRVADHQCHEPAFHWPGLEAVIESYHHYVEEQALEKQLLNEQSQRLRQHHADLMTTAERLRAHMPDLLYSKQQLVEERLKVQKLIDGLKDSLKPFL